MGHLSQNPLENQKKICLLLPHSTSALPPSLIFRQSPLHQSPAPQGCCFQHLTAGNFICQQKNLSFLPTFSLTYVYFTFSLDSSVGSGGAASIAASAATEFPLDGKVGLGQGLLSAPLSAIKHFVST
jgi:hypothetical protein